MQNNGYNYDGSTDTDNDRFTNNKIAKSMAADTLWGVNSINGAAGNSDYAEYRNKSGFSALPGGYRDAEGWFYGVGDGGCGVWLSSSEFSSTMSWCRQISTDKTSLMLETWYKGRGRSVRCVKDK